jgi:hypothetical protein
MPTLSTDSGRPLAEASAADAAQARLAARIETAETERTEPAAPPKRAAAPAVTEKPKRGRPPGKRELPRTASTALVVLSDAQRGKQVQGFAQVGAGLLLLTSKTRKSDALRADALTIAAHAEEIADACVETARVAPGFAAALDKICAAGPYAALVSVMFTVGTQCARNHKPGLELPGTVDPAKILAAAAEAEQDDDDTAAAA